MSLADLGMALLTVLLAIVVLSFVSLCERRLGADQKTIQKRNVLYAFVMGGWLLLTGLLAMRGEIGASQVPVIMVPSVLGVVIYVLSPAGARMLRGLRDWEIIALQIFRLPVELILLFYFYDNRVPISMTFEGRNFDIVTALTAMVVAPLVAFGKAGRRTILFWNCLGLALLANIVTIAVRAVFPSEVEGLNTLPFAWPSVWILYAVLVALASHLLLFRKLLQRS